jgi:hypothetical protein
MLLPYACCYRSIGDLPYRPHGLTSQPEMSAMLQLSPADAFLVLASDGLYEVMSPEDVCDQAWAVAAGQGHLAKTPCPPPPIALGGPPADAAEDGADGSSDPSSWSDDDASDSDAAGGSRQQPHEADSSSNSGGSAAAAVPGLRGCCDCLPRPAGMEQRGDWSRCCECWPGPLRSSNSSSTSSWVAGPPTLEQAVALHLAQQAYNSLSMDNLAVVVLHVTSYLASLRNGKHAANQVLSPAQQAQLHEGQHSHDRSAASTGGSAAAAQQLEEPEEHVGGEEAEPLQLLPASLGPEDPADSDTPTAACHIIPATRSHLSPAIPSASHNRQAPHDTASTAVQPAAAAQAADLQGHQLQCGTGSPEYTLVEKLSWMPSIPYHLHLHQDLAAHPLYTLLGQGALQPWDPVDPQQQQYSSWDGTGADAGAVQEWWGATGGAAPGSTAGGGDAVSTAVAGLSSLLDYHAAGSAGSFLQAVLPASCDSSAAVCLPADRQAGAGQEDHPSRLLLLALLAADDASSMPGAASAGSSADDGQGAQSAGGAAPARPLPPAVFTAAGLLKALLRPSSLISSLVSTLLQPKPQSANASSEVASSVATVASPAAPGSSPASPPGGAHKGRQHSASTPAAALSLLATSGRTLMSMSDDSDGTSDASSAPRAQQIASSSTGVARSMRGPGASKAGQRYSLGQRFGQGHFGEVWRAVRAGTVQPTDQDFGAMLVLKRVLSERGHHVMLSGRREAYFGTLFNRAAAATVHSGGAGPEGEPSCVLLGVTRCPSDGCRSMLLLRCRWPLPFTRNKLVHAWTCTPSGGAHPCCTWPSTGPEPL